MENNIETWSDFFHSIKNEEYCLSLHKFLDKEYQNKTIFPPRNLMFNAFNLTALKDVKVVIIGQDPYHEKGQAMGLSFSVPKGVKVPPSLVNIYQEIKNEYGYDMNFSNGDLTYLASQGVLLLNSILSVEEGKAFSHNIEEYSKFFEAVLSILDKQYRPMVFLLWGNSARKLKRYLHNPDHLILESSHPSPLSANRGGWFNNRHFLLTNEYLKKNHLKEINWCNQ